jgi:type I restriction enzyme, S subunit
VSRRWKTHTFDSAPLEIIDGDRGKEYPKQDEFFDDGYCLFLDAGNVTGGGFDFSQCHFISEQKDQALRKGRLKREDVVLTTRGTIGNIGLFGENVPYENLRINSGMVILRAKPAELLPAFLYQYLRSPDFKGQVNSLRSGVAQPQLPIRDIKRIQIPMPAFNVQQRIADILSAYDDLIENNRRRMELLEEAARQLYREWFIRLRFPGREHTRIINGVPEGWERTAFENALVLQRGFDLPIQAREEGDVSVYGSTGINGFHKRAKVQGPGIVTGRSGTLGEVHYAPRDFWPLNTALWVKEFKLVTPLFAFFLLREMDLKQYNGGVSVPSLDRKAVHRVEILLPPRKLIAVFDEFASPLFVQIENLGAQNEKLRAARDLLLPRLMSGEIAV